MKKINVKRLLSLFLALALGVSAFGLVGCSSAPATVDGDLSFVNYRSDGITLSMTNVSTMSSATSNYLSKMLTATVSTTSEDPLNKMVDWSVAWLDETIEDDVASYITVIPGYDGSCEAEVRCLAPFTNTVVITCTTRVGNFKATCLVSYIGTPSAISVSSVEGLATVQHSVSTDVALYELESGNDFSFDINLSNIFGPSTAGFAPNYVISVECVNKIGIDVVYEGSNPGSVVDWVIPAYVSDSGEIKINKSYTMDPFKPLFVDSVLAKITLQDNKVIVSSSLAPEAITATVGSSEKHSLSFYRYGATAGPNYYVVTITETNTGLSTSFNFRTVSSVSAVTLDNTALEF